VILFAPNPTTGTATGSSSTGIDADAAEAQVKTVVLMCMSFCVYFCLYSFVGVVVPNSIKIVSWTLTVFVLFCCLSHEVLPRIFLHVFSQTSSNLGYYTGLFLTSLLSCVLTMVAMHYYLKSTATPNNHVGAGSAVSKLFFNSRRADYAPIPDANL